MPMSIDSSDTAWGRSEVAVPEASSRFLRKPPLDLGSSRHSNANISAKDSGLQPNASNEPRLLFLNSSSGNPYSTSKRVSDRKAINQHVQLNLIAKRRLASGGRARASRSQRTRSLPLRTDSMQVRQDDQEIKEQHALLAMNEERFLDRNGIFFEEDDSTDDALDHSR